MWQFHTIRLQKLCFNFKRELFSSLENHHGIFDRKTWQWKFGMSQPQFPYYWENVQSFAIKNWLGTDEFWWSWSDMRNIWSWKQTWFNALTWKWKADFSSVMWIYLTWVHHHRRQRDHPHCLMICAWISCSENLLCRCGYNFYAYTVQFVRIAEDIWMNCHPSSSTNLIRLIAIPFHLACSLSLKTRSTHTQEVLKILCVVLCESGILMKKEWWWNSRSLLQSHKRKGGCWDIFCLFWGENVIRMALLWIFSFFSQKDVV